MSKRGYMRLDLDRTQIDALLRGEGGPVVRFVSSTLRRTRTVAVLRCPVRSGRLRNSIREEFLVRGDIVGGTVGTDVSYASHVHDGTRPHTIRPRHPGGVLRFIAGGEVVFATYARHPGTKAQPFLADALREVAGDAGFDIHIR